jgi:ABC-type multidrug transport system ATPase subunit
MRKRLALARVLQQDARVVLLDEPYGDLDPPGFLLVDGILERLRASRATVLMATHLLRRGQALCSRALVLESGRLAYSGAASEMPGPAGTEERVCGVASREGPRPEHTGDLAGFAEGA